MRRVCISLGYRGLLGLVVLVSKCDLWNCADHSVLLKSRALGNGGSESICVHQSGELLEGIHAKIALLAKRIQTVIPGGIENNVVDMAVFLGSLAVSMSIVSRLIPIQMEMGCVFLSTGVESQ